MKNETTTHLGYDYEVIESTPCLFQAMHGHHNCMSKQHFLCVSLFRTWVFFWGGGGSLFLHFALRAALTPSHMCLVDSLGFP